jgi:DNA polymerase III alpha subunit
VSGAWDGRYAELGAMTNFSFLEGASHPGEIMHQAKSLGLAAVGVADRNTLAGMVRALMGAEEAEVPLVVGARLGFVDGTELIVFPRDRAAYGRLCRLLTLGKSEVVPQAGADPEDDRIEKAETRLTFDQAVGLGAGMIALVPAPDRADAAFEARLAAWRRAWPDDLLLAQPAGRHGAANGRADDRHQCGALPPPRPAAVAGRPDLHPREDDHRRRRPASAGQRRAEPEAPGPHGPAVPGP